MSHESVVAPIDPAGEPGSTVQHQVYCHIKRQILVGAIGPGERINIAEIADVLLVSRMPVREALRQLDAQGLVSMRPNRGASVVDLTPAEAEEYFEIRAALEGLAVGLAVPRLTDDDLEQLALANEQMERARPEPVLWLHRHRRFHAALWQNCGRPRLISELNRITELLTPLAAAQFVRGGVNPQRVHDHDFILQKMQARDASAAEDAVRQHILSVGRVMVDRLGSAGTRRVAHI